MSTATPQPTAPAEQRRRGLPSREELPPWV
jgi:hypothetical protein